jgi:tetratricopeptide (TPR) repeat protein
VDARQEGDAPYSEELFGRPSTVARIFVSSHMGRRNVLRAEREAAARAIESTGIARAWYWERDAHAGPYSSERTCVGTAATSDGLVLILAGKLTRVTRMEYQAAHDAGAPCFIFVKQDARPAPDVRRFIAQERRHGAITVGFGSVEELRTRIVDALQAHFVSASRRHALEVRLYRSRSDPARHAAPVGGRADGGRPRYEAIELEVEFAEGFRRAGEVVAEARHAAAAGQVTAAFEALYELATDAQRAGLPDVALELLAELRAVVPSPTLNDEQHAWLLNTEGLARMGVGERGRAGDLFERMLASGQRQGDELITSTALHNLGILAVLRGDPNQAIDHYKRSLDLKQAIGDYYGGTQVLLNLAAPLLDTGKGEWAEELLYDLERPIRSMGEPGLLGSVHGHLGQVAARRGQFEIAERRFRRALQLARSSAASPRHEVVALQNLGSLEVDQGRPVRALRWYRKALAIAERLGAPAELELVHRSLAHALHLLNRDREAAAEFGQAAAAADACGHRSLWAENTANVGAARVLLGEVEVGVAVLNQALDVFRIVGDAQWQARVLANLAAARQQTGDTTNAFALLDAAIDLPVEEPEERADLLRHAAEMALETRQGDRAADYLERELEAIRGAPSRQRAWRAATAGSLLRQSGAPARAVAFYDRAVRAYERLGEHELLYRSVNDRAIAYSELERYGEARRDLSRCLRLARRRDDRAMEQQALANLGETDRREGRIRPALQRLRKAHELARAVGDADAEAFTLGNLGIALVDAGRWDEAEDAYGRALTLARSLGEPEYQATALAGLARIALHRERPAEAARLYRRAVALRGERDHRHLAEHLGGLVEVLASLGREQELEREAQRLVDLAQANGDEDVAVHGLARAAWQLLQRDDQDGAASFYATAVVLAGVSGTSDEDHPTAEATAKALAEALIEPVTYLLRDGEALERARADALYALVADKADGHVEGLGEAVRLLVEEAAQLFREGTAEPARG